MARITIEDCIEKVPNRFHLVQMTAIRAKQLKRGANALVGNEENKEVVVALREIAAGLVGPDEGAEIETAATNEAGVAQRAPIAEPVPTEAAVSGGETPPTE